VVLVEDALDQRGHVRREGRVAVHHHLHGGRELEGLVRRRQRRVDVVAAELGQSQPLRLELEVALEQRYVLAAHGEQRIDHLVGQVIFQVARPDRGSIAAQFLAFGVPIAGAVDIHLRQHDGILLVDAEQFPIGALAHIGRGAVEEGGQLVARHRLRLAVHL
jgi:hypothetical protein